MSSSNAGVNSGFAHGANLLDRWKLYRIINRDTELSPAARRVAFELLDGSFPVKGHATQRYTKLTVKQLSALTELHRNNVAAGVDKLIARGYLAVLSQGHTGHARELSFDAASWTQHSHWVDPFAPARGYDADAPKSVHDDVAAVEQPCTKNSACPETDAPKTVHALKPMHQNQCIDALKTVHARTKNSAPYSLNPAETNVAGLRDNSTPLPGSVAGAPSPSASEGKDEEEADSPGGFEALWAVWNRKRQDWKADAIQAYRAALASGAFSREALLAKAAGYAEWERGTDIPADRRKSLHKWIAEQVEKAGRQDAEKGGKAESRNDHKASVTSAANAEPEWQDDEDEESDPVYEAKERALYAAARLLLPHEGDFYVGDFVRRGPEYGIVIEGAQTFGPMPRLDVMRVYEQDGRYYNAWDAITPDWEHCTEEEFYDAFPGMENTPPLAHGCIVLARKELTARVAWLLDAVPSLDLVAVSAADYAAEVHAAAEAEATRRREEAEEKWQKAEEARQRRYEAQERQREAERAARVAAEAEKKRKAEEAFERRWREGLRKNGDKLADIRADLSLTRYEVEDETGFDSDRLAALEAGTAALPVGDGAAMLAAYKEAAAAVRAAAAAVASYQSATDDDVPQD